MRVLLVLLLAACSEDTAVVDAASMDADPIDVPSCEDDACVTTDVLATFGPTNESFDLAYFGYEGERLRVEIYGGAEPGCPTMDSPTPDRTLVIPSLDPLEAGDVVVTLLDFAGTLTSEPLLRATSASTSPLASSLGGPDAFVRFDLDAAFEGGSIRGVVYATHCASLDGD